MGFTVDVAGRPMGLPFVVLLPVRSLAVAMAGRCTGTRVLLHQNDRPPDLVWRERSGWAMLSNKDVDVKRLAQLEPFAAIHPDVMDRLDVEGAWVSSGLAVHGHCACM